jgi:hypothetical protein
MMTVEIFENVDNFFCPFGVSTFKKKFGFEKPESFCCWKAFQASLMFEVKGRAPKGDWCKFQQYFKSSFFIRKVFAQLL